jgi:Tol biopolymer transport system component
MQHSLLIAVKPAVVLLLGCAVLPSAAPLRSQTTVPAVVFARAGDLYAIAADGSRTIPLTRTREEEHDPAVSPDGRTILFSYGFGGIARMNVDGSARRVLTRGPDGDPAWAPDGQTIYFVRIEPGLGNDVCSSIFRAPATGGRARRFTNSRGLHSHHNPAVSQDGQRIAFTDHTACDDDTASLRLRVVDSSGRRTGDLAKLPRNGSVPNLEYSAPAWSPDGMRLAFLRNTDDLTVANRDGSGERRLARGGDLSLRIAPAWSPDGSTIAFSIWRKGGASLLLVRPDGTGLRRLAFDRSVHWYSIGGWLPQLPS